MQGTPQQRVKQHAAVLVKCLRVDYPQTPLDGPKVISTIRDIVESAKEARDGGKGDEQLRNEINDIGNKLAKALKALLVEIKSQTPSVERFSLCREVLCKLIAKLVLLICEGSGSKRSAAPSGNGETAKKTNEVEDEAEAERKFQEELARNLARERQRELERELAEQKEQMRKISESQYFRERETEKQEGALKSFLEGSGKLASPRQEERAKTPRTLKDGSTDPHFVVASTKASIAVVSQASVPVQQQQQSQFQVGNVKEKIERLRAGQTSPTHEPASPTGPSSSSSSASEEESDEGSKRKVLGRGKGSKRNKEKKIKKAKEKKAIKDNKKSKKEGVGEEWEKELWRREEEQKRREQELREKEVLLKKKQAEIEKKKRELEKEEAKKKREEQFKQKEEELKRREMALKRQEEEELAKEKGLKEGGPTKAVPKPDEKGKQPQPASVESLKRPQLAKKEARLREMRLRKILRVGESRAFFIKYWEKAATLLPPDYLLFWEIVHEFKSIYGAPGNSGSVKSVQFQINAHKIVDKFFKKDALSYKISLPTGMIRQLQTCENFTLTSFDEAQEYVFNLILETNILEDFLKSDIWLKYQNEEGGIRTGSDGGYISMEKVISRMKNKNYGITKDNGEHFSGAAAIGWIIKHVNINSREEATNLGKQMILAGYLCQEGGADFKDSFDLLFTFQKGCKSILEILEDETEDMTDTEFVRLLAHMLGLETEHEAYLKKLFLEIEENEKIDYNLVINRFRSEQDFKSFEDYLTKHCHKIEMLIRESDGEKDEDTEYLDAIMQKILDFLAYEQGRGC